ncbi:hypothetical protein [Streptomyces olivochromogenes]|uniref:hypothetical protein n=1 Tax=Streptomyces olivochromogenes TaxID=1963 RepID=UPI00368F43C9
MKKNQARPHAPAREVTGDQAVAHHMEPINEDRRARGMKFAAQPDTCPPGMTRDASGECVPQDGG